MNAQEPTAAPLNPDPLLDVPQAAEYLGTSERHVRLLTSKEKVRFRRSELNTYLVTRTTPAKVGE
jgi:predicted DNA-binding transcriptional regulator AlpA